MRYYRATVVLSALSWLMVGMHLPMLHDMTHEGRSTRWDVLAVTALLTVVGIVGVILLLRAPGSDRSAPGSSARA